jgi:hypothetical protein
LEDTRESLLTDARAAQRTCGHLHIDALHQLAETRIEAIARLRQRHLDLAQDPARIAAEHQDPVAHQNRLFDVVRHQNDALDGHPALGPQIQEIGAQRLGGEHIERRKWFIHEQNIRMHHEGAGESHALPHAARKLARVGGLESVQADEIDRRQRPLANIRPRHSLRLQAERDVLEHGQPRKQGEALEHHRNTGRRA